LDLSRNKIRLLPESIGNLTSLKVLSISGNRIQRLPLCIGDLDRLALLKFDNNPLTFPPPEVYAQDSDLTRRGNFQQEEAMATDKVKKFLKQQSLRFGLRERSQTESDIDTGYGIPSSIFTIPTDGTI
jgi:Leucine-rich repeat (LRR) protein